MVHNSILIYSSKIKRPDVDLIRTCVHIYFLQLSICIYPVIEEITAPSNSHSPPSESD